MRYSNRKFAQNSREINVFVLEYQDNALILGNKSDKKKVLD